MGYSYSPEGWITGRSFNVSGGLTYGLGYAYDDLGRLQKVVYPDGNSANYYYQDGAVYQVGLQVGKYYVYGVTNVTYRPMDQAMSGWTGYNGLANTITYDSDLRPISISVPSVESLAFTYDAANRITRITNGLNGNLTQNFGYDPLNRLTSIGLPSETVTYAYDADGNRVSKVDNGAVTNFSYASNSNRLLSVTGAMMNATYGYNANGDTTIVDNLTAYQYGPFDRLANAGGEAYRNSAEGQRIFKQGASGMTYFASSANGTPMAEHQSTNGLWLDYVWLNGKLVTVVTSDGGVYPVHDDQTGRPIAMTNLGNQSIIWQAQNLPFMRNVTTTTRFDFNIGFPGQYFDSESGLWHNGQRDYDASLGRYIESDPIGLGGGVNTYAYVGDNPISNVDPLGLCNKCSKSQQAAANAAETFAREAQLFAGAALVADAASASSALRGGEGKAVWAGLAGSVASRAAAVSAITGAALDTYASSPNSVLGAAEYFGSFVVDQATSFVGKFGVLSSLPNAIELGNLAGDVGGQSVDSALPPLPNPCTSP